MKTALATIVLALALAPVAAAKSAPPLVPLQQQDQMKSVLDSFNFEALEYIPTKAPANYSYSANVVNTTENLITLVDGTSNVYFSAQFFNGKLTDCAKGSQVSLTIGGARVYSSGTNVWRCLASGGKVVKLNANGPGVSREDLGTVVTSVKRIP